MQLKLHPNRLVLIGVGALIQAAAHAADAPPTEVAEVQLEEVVVTAQRREENQQRVPIEIHAIDAAAAAAMGITDAEDLGKLVPGLIFDHNTKSGIIFLRGVGSPTDAPGTESPVATYMDGVYIASMSGNMLSLSGVERVEVDNGPQGTLFGRNALGGAIQVITKTPQSTPSMDASVGYANYGTTQASFYGTDGITDTLSGSLSFDYSHQEDGWGRDIATGQDVFKPESASARVKLLWKPDEKAMITGWFYYGDLRDNPGAATAFIPGSIGLDHVTTAPSNFYDVDANIRGQYFNQQWIGSVRADFDLTWARFTSISAYDWVRSSASLDLDSTPQSISEQNPNDLFSKTGTQEFQLASAPNQRITWIGGVYYYYNVSGVDPAHVLGTGVESACGATCTFYDIYTRPLTHSIATYAQATGEIVTDLHLTTGVRYTKDIRDITGENVASTGLVFGKGDQEKSWPNISYRVALDYDITKDVMTYVSYSTGFNSGYFNGGAPSQPAVNPAKIEDAEAGIKSEFFDHRVRVNLSGFDYNYENIVLKQVVSTGTVRLLNAASAREYGADASFEIAATSQLAIQGALEALHADFTNFTNAPLTVPVATGGNATIVGDLTGQEMFFAPSFTGTIGAQYEIPTAVGKFQLASSYQYNGGYNWGGTADAAGTPSNRIRQSSYNLLNASLQWKSSDDRWSVRFWGKNITSTKYWSYASTSANGDVYSPAAPATFGVTASMHL
jgi:iron complex outermembrane recepter protein